MILRCYWEFFRLGLTWEEARLKLFEKSPLLFSSPKKILLFPGLLSEYSGYDFGGNAFKGGYLGELTQWSDLIAVRCIMCYHDLCLKIIIICYELLALWGYLPAL